MWKFVHQNNSTKNCKRHRHSQKDTADSCRTLGYSRWKFCGTILASCLCRFLLQAIKYSQWPNRMQMLSTNLSSFERALVILDVPAAPRFKNIHWCITALFDAFIIVQMLVCYLCCRQECAGCSMRPQFCLPSFTFSKEKRPTWRRGSGLT